MPARNGKSDKLHCFLRMPKIFYSETFERSYNTLLCLNKRLITYTKQDWVSKNNHFHDDKA